VVQTLHRTTQITSEQHKHKLTTQIQTNNTNTNVRLFKEKCSEICAANHRLMTKSTAAAAAAAAMNTIIS
jgi:hypothetical protein